MKIILYSIAALILIAWALQKISYHAAKLIYILPLALLFSGLAVNVKNDKNR